MRGWLLAGAFVFLVISGRVWWSSQTEFEAASEAEKNGDIHQAISHYQYASRWYIPFANTPPNARRALIRIAKQALDTGDQATALMAYRRLRSSILSTRGLFSPGMKHLESTNIGIARLMAKAQFKAGGPTVRGRTESQLYEDHLTLLKLDPIPARGWSLLVILSFIAWVWTALLAIRRGFHADLRIKRRPMLILGTTSLSFFLLWTFALSQA